MKIEELLEIATQLCNLTRDAPLLVGVSGGPDSLCLLDGLARLQFPVIVAHFDHRLRPESAQDAGLVRSVAERLGVPFILGSGDVAGYAQAEKLSVEAAARSLRYRFLFEQARHFEAQAVAVAHTADDQVETLLMHLLRGAGLAGLVGMRFSTHLREWDTSIPLVRPLLAFWREETLAYCQERDLPAVFDPTNQDVTFFRNRLRHELIPLLETYNPQVRENLWRTAQTLAGDEAIVREAVQAAWEGCRAEERSDYVALRRKDFCALSPGLQRGVLRLAIARHRNASQRILDIPSVERQPAQSLVLRDVDFAAIDRAVRFAHGEGNGQIDLVGGMRLVAESERLLVAQGGLPVEPGWPRLEAGEIDLPIPGEIDLPHGWRLVITLAGPEDFPGFNAPETSRWEAWLDLDTLASVPLPGPLCLRRARPGERFKPLGMDGHSMKLSDFWTNQKLPSRARQDWPLVAAGTSVVWIPGFRMAHPFRIQKSTRQGLHLRLYHVED